MKSWTKIKDIQTKPPYHTSIYFKTKNGDIHSGIMLNYNQFKSISHRTFDLNEVEEWRINLDFREDVEILREDVIHHGSAAIRVSLKDDIGNYWVARIEELGVEFRESMRNKAICEAKNHVDRNLNLHIL